MLAELAVNMLWKEHISIDVVDVVDVDALHGDLDLANGLQRLLHTVTAVELLLRLAESAINMLWEGHFSIDVVDVDASHGHLNLANGLQTLLHIPMRCLG